MATYTLFNRLMSKQELLSEGLADFFDNSMITEPVSALKRAASALVDAGFDLGTRKWWIAKDAILITEAVNWAAKVIDEEFYSLKPACVKECLELGAEGGWRNGIFYLYHPDVRSHVHSTQGSQISLSSLNGFVPNVLTCQI